MSTMSHESRSPEDSSEPPRKKMRKGTHSCSECRRRKVRCLYSSPDASICSECVARGTRCVSQEDEEPVPDQRKNLRERVGRLEALVESLIKRGDEPMDDLGNSPVTPDPALTTSPLQVDSTSRAAGLNDIAPALSLFDNAVFGRKDPDADVLANDKSDTASSRTVVSPGQDSICPTSKGKLDAVRRELTKLIPSERDLETLFNSTSGWWLIWRDLCAAIYESTTEISLTQVVSRALRKGHPIIIAHSLLCIAISIQQLPPTFDYTRLRLPMPAEDLMKYYMSIVHRLVVSDDDFAGSLDGLDVMILHSKLHINLGQPRQAWLTFRRAMSYGLIMGLHRDPCLREETMTPILRRRRNLWWKLYSSDRYLTVLLGLPYATNDTHCNLAVDDEDGENGVESPEKFRRLTTVLCSRVIDRNQAFNGPDLALTLQIDQQLDDLRRRVPEEWWQLAQKPEEASSSHYDRLSSHFWYHQVRSLLHLPFLLQSLTNSSYEYSRLVCLSASREMIRTYLVLRENAMVGPYLCKVIDFQVFTAAMLLLVNLVGVGRLWPAVEPERDQDDSDLVDSTIEILRGAAEEIGSAVASQSVAVLEALKVNKSQSTAQCDNCSNKKLVIPFFGTITIGPGSAWKAVENSTSSVTNVLPVVPPPPATFLPSSSAASNPSAVPFGVDYPPPHVPMESVGNFFGQFPPGGHVPHNDNFAVADPSWQSILNMDLNQNWNLSLDDIGLAPLGRL